MRINTVRSRLTFWSVATLTTVLLLFSIGVYVLSSRMLHERLDASLRSAAQVTELSLNHEIEEHGGRDAGEASVRDVLRTMHQTSFPRSAIAVWDGNRLVADKPGLDGLPSSDLPRDAVARPGIRSFTHRSIEYRLLTVSAFVRSVGGEYRVTVNESTRDIDSELANLRGVLLLLVPLSVLLCAFGGYLL